MTATAPTFPPLTAEFTWTPSTTSGGQPLPPGEVETGSTIGIRADGDTTHGVGNYQWLIPIAGAGMSETLAELTAFLGKALPAGNYWGAVDQTDTLNGQSATSPWSGEIDFSIPATLMTPDVPTALKAA
jgi:hypothetical protein